ncbi:MAG: lysophospholipid acyltransferase family protein [Candidatus Binatia bacterium]
MAVFFILKLVLLGVNTLVLVPLIVAVAVFDENLAYGLCRVWARTNLFFFRIRVHSRRLAPVDPRGTYVFMSNHASQLDPLALVAALPEFQMRWVAKKELTRVPIFGWGLRRAGHIVIDRSNHMAAIERLRQAGARTKEGISVIIFPEGTRSRDEQMLLPFKKGGFMLALEAGIPIVPVAVRGSRPLLPRNEWRIRGGDIEVVVGAPIPVVGQSRDELIRRLRAFMIAELGLPAEPAARAAAEAS